MMSALIIGLLSGWLFMSMAKYHRLAWRTMHYRHRRVMQVANLKDQLRRERIRHSHRASSYFNPN